MGYKIKKVYCPLCCCISLLAPDKSSDKVACCNENCKAYRVLITKPEIYHG